MSVFAIIFFIILLVASIAFLVWYIPQVSKESKNELSRIKNECKYNETKRISIESLILSIDENSKQFYISASFLPTDIKVYHFSDIVDVQILQNKKVLASHKTSLTSAIGRGIVGAALFGGVGAIIGASTAKQKSNTEISLENIAISIVIKDLENPQIRIDCERISAKKVDELYSCLIAMTNVA